MVIQESFLLVITFLATSLTAIQFYSFHGNYESTKFGKLITTLVIINIIAIQGIKNIPIDSS